MKISSITKKKLAQSVLNLLGKKGINAIPMKLYSDDEDIDVVVIDNNQYKNAKYILKLNHWLIKNNKSKIRERDKDFFKNKKYPYSLHLHQAFSWNTITYLDSKEVWKRRRKTNGFSLPSIEDELLIIGAHSLFENQYIKPEEFLYGKELLKNKVNFKYLKKYADKFNWKKGIEIIVSKLINGDSSLSIAELISVKTSKLIKDFGKTSIGQLATEIINYFLIDWIWNYRQFLKKQLKKAPLVITLSGIDGCGKSTQTKLLRNFLIKNGKIVKVVHIGGIPSNGNTSEQHYKIPGLEYLAYAKDFLNIFLSYIKNYKADVLIYDRYFYDTLVKISYKKKQKKITKSLLSILTLFLPKPSLSILLRLPAKLSLKRDKDHSLSYHKEKHNLYFSLISVFPDIKEINAIGNKHNVETTIKKELPSIF